MEKADVIAHAKLRAEPHLEKQMWLAAWIIFKTDMQRSEELRNHPVLSLGDTLANFLLDASLGVPADSDEALVMKVYSTGQIKAMIEAAK